MKFGIELIMITLYIPNYSPLQMAKYQVFILSCSTCLLYMLSLGLMCDNFRNCLSLQQDKKPSFSTST